MSLLEEIIADCAPPVEPFDVSLPKGKVLVFRSVAGATEIDELDKKGWQFSREVRAKTLPGHHEYAGLPAKTIRNAHWLGSMMVGVKVEGALREEPLDRLGWLKVAKEAGPTFEYVFNEVELAQMGFHGRAEDAAVGELKNDSGAIHEEQ